MRNKKRQYKKTTKTTPKKTVLVDQWEKVKIFCLQEDLLQSIRLDQKDVVFRSLSLVTLVLYSIKLDFSPALHNVVMPILNL